MKATAFLFRIGQSALAILALALQSVSADTSLGNIPAGTSPSGVAVNPVTNKIYVANNGSDNVTVIDGATNATATVNVGRNPFRVAVNPMSNKIYVTNAGSNDVTVIDGATNETATLNTGTGTPRVAVNPVTNKIYVTNAGSNDVTVIDGATNTPATVTAVTTGANPVAIAVNPVTNKIYVANVGSNDVTVIDGATATATDTVNVGTNPVEVAVNPVTNKIYVANLNGNSVTVINGATNDTITVNTGMLNSGVAVNPVTNKIYVTNRGSGNVTVIDGATNETTTVSVGSNPFGAAVNPLTNKIYVPNGDSNDVTVIDGATNLTVTVNVGSIPASVAVDPVTKRIYVANNGSNNVTVIDGAANTPATVTTGANPVAIAVNPVTNKTYITNNNVASVTVIDGATNATATISVGANPIRVAVNPVTNRIYVANFFGNSVTVIDGATNAPITVNVGINPFALAVNPVTNKIFVVNSGDTLNSSSVTVIDAAKNNVTETVGIGLPRVGPPLAYSVAVNPVTNKTYVVRPDSDSVTVIDGVTLGTNTVSVGSNPNTLAVNPVTNKIYVANANSGSVTAIDGVTNATITIPVGNFPQDVAVNPVTNKIYVANRNSPSVTVIDGATNQTTTIAVALGPDAVAVDTAINKIYAVHPNSNLVTIIDGATNATTTVSAGAFPNAVAVNPVTNKVYVANQVSSDVTVIDVSPRQASFLQTGIGPLPANTTFNASPSFNFSAVSGYAPATPLVQRIYYQVDTMIGPWLAAAPAGGSASGATPLLHRGLHVLYAFATDGMDATSINTGYGSSPIIGRISAYPFLYGALPPGDGSFFFRDSRVITYESDLTARVTVQRDFNAPATVQFRTVNDTAVSPDDFTAVQGTLTFAQDESSKTITVPIRNDDVAEPVKSFTLQLSNASGTSVVGDPGTVRVVILDDDTSDLGLSSPSATLPQSAPTAIGSITVTLGPPEAQGQWRLFGELDWRNSGDRATGLTGGNYGVEFRPVAGYDTPPLQPAPLAADQEFMTDETYQEAGTAMVGSLTVFIAPANVGGWRLLGEVLDPVLYPSGYRPGGNTIQNLNIGSHIIEFQGPVDGRVTPSKRVVAIQADQTTTITTTYQVGDSRTGAPPQLVDDSLARTTAPYIFTGQIQTDSGFDSGFVPRDRVVVTAAHVLFDDGSLSFAEGVRWFFQHARGVFETEPQIPRGSYIFEGYAAQRVAANDPGVSNSASRQLDAAVLYFLEPAARGGASGYLASDSSANSWLTGTRDKMIVGYPVDGVPPDSVGRLHATPAVQSPLEFVSGRLFRSDALTGFPGTGGGPLCVLFDDGRFYPAAIYLGGTAQTVVRAIDHQIIDLIERAQVSGNGGDNNVGGGIIQVNAGLTGTTLLAFGSLKVNLSPGEAVQAGARWIFGGESTTRTSGEAKAGLVPLLFYDVAYTDVPGYATPGPASVMVTANTETLVPGVYIPNQAPRITHAGTATTIAGQPFSYQIQATLHPITSYGADSLPPGLTINPLSGLIFGIPSVAGEFDIRLRATNAAGTGNAVLALTVAKPGRLKVTVTGDGTVPKRYRKSTVQAVGSLIRILATPGPRSLFNEWTDGDTGTVLSTNAAYAFTMPDQRHLVANFVENPFLRTAGSYTGLLKTGTLARSGFVRLTVTRSGTFTARIIIGGQTTIVRNRFDLQRKYAGQIVVLPGGQSFGLALTLNDDGTLSAMLEDRLNGNTLLSVRAVRTFDQAHLAKRFAGTYTVVMPLVNPDSSLPEGHGFGTLTVVRSGAMRFAGILGDGTAISGSGYLGRDRAWALYIVPSGTGGAVLGSVAATNPSAPDGFAGTLDWFRPPNPTDPLYPAGFNTQIAFSAARYAPPPVDYRKASVTFSGGGIPSPIMKAIVIQSHTRANATGSRPFTMRFVPSTGLFTGSFLDTGSSAARKFKGAVIQRDDSGMGFFRGAENRTGSVFLEKTP